MSHHYETRDHAAEQLASAVILLQDIAQGVGEASIAVRHRCDVWLDERGYDCPKRLAKKSVTRRLEIDAQIRKLQEERAKL